MGMAGYEVTSQPFSLTNTEHLILIRQMREEVR
jgi:hypothetical protein